MVSSTFISATPVLPSSTSASEASAGRPTRPNFLVWHCLVELPNELWLKRASAGWTLGVWLPSQQLLSFQSLLSFVDAVGSVRECLYPSFLLRLLYKTRSGVVKPRRSINIAFRLLYLWIWKGEVERPSRLMRPRPKVLRRLNYISRHRRRSDEDRTEFLSG